MGISFNEAVEKASEEAISKPVTATTRQIPNYYWARNSK